MTPSLIVLAVFLPLVQEEWKQWRGPGNCGSAEGCSPPLVWSSKQNVRWQSKVVGRGAATPIVVKDRVILLTAVETNEERTPAPRKPLRQNKPNDPPPPDPPSRVYDFIVLCYARDDGRLLWQKTVNSELPQEGHHPDGSYASGSAVSDGQTIYAYFNSFGLYALDLEGELLWKQDFGEMSFDRGEGASAALYGNRIVIPWDHRGQSEVITVDSKTGVIEWRHHRSEGASRSTPAVAEISGRSQAVLYGRTVYGYDLETGETIWTCETHASGSIASPIIADGMAFFYTSTGKSRFFGAIDLTQAKGDCTQSLLWQEAREVPKISSPAYHRGILYVLKGDSTLMSAYDPRTGTRHWGPERLNLWTVYSSIVAAEDRVYVTDREGVTLVLRHGTQFEVLQRNDLGEEVVSSMALVGKEIFLRGKENLYCIEESSPEPGSD